MDFAPGLAHLTAVDQRFDALASQYGTPEWQPATASLQPLCRAIVYQQLSGKAAGTIYGRFLAIYDGVFPTAAQILETEHDHLRAAGLSNSKALYLKNIATAFTDGSVNADQFAMLPDAEISQQLTAIKGIGQWTVDMFLMSTLCKPDILPVGDHGVKKGMQAFFQLADLPKPKEMRELATPWQPYRSLASWYMWRVADTLNP